MIKENSVMAVVVCRNKVLTTYELIYGNLKVSLPKGHLELGETLMECAIRETYEEANIIIDSSNFYKELSSFEICFNNHDSEEVCKTITPLLFFICEEGNPEPKEKRMVHVEYLEFDEFLKRCSYDNVKKIIEEARKYIYE